MVSPWSDDSAHLEAWDTALGCQAAEAVGEMLDVAVEEDVVDTATLMGAEERLTEALRSRSARRLSLKALAPDADPVHQAVQVAHNPAGMILLTPGTHYSRTTQPPQLLLHL